MPPLVGLDLPKACLARLICRKADCANGFLGLVRADVNQLNSSLTRSTPDSLALAE